MDRAIPIRENCTKVLPGFNSMIHSGTLHVGEKEVPCRPLTAADMQGTKALYGMSAASHAVWCKCRKGKGQHDYPKDAVTTKEEMLAAINAVGCKMKTEEEMCEWAHYSFGIHRGRAFTPVHCRLCGYKAATETKWRADVLPKMPHFCSNITPNSLKTVSGSPSGVISCAHKLGALL